MGKLAIFSSFCSFAKGPRSAPKRYYTCPGSIKRSAEKNLGSIRQVEPTRDCGTFGVRDSSFDRLIAKHHRVLSLLKVSLIRLNPNFIRRVQ